MAIATGTRLGSYEVMNLLGAGGMGEVWRARDTRLHRDVAIKILPANFAADADRSARFEREAHALASLNHPNIAAIHDFQRTDGNSFLVLELVDGETLSEALKRGPLPIRDALPIAIQIAEALGAAHAKGICIQRFPQPAEKKRLSQGGGYLPRWRPDGKELFYIAQDLKVMSLPIAIGNLEPFVVSPDGQRFLLIPLNRAPNTSISLIMNWYTLLKP